MATTKKETTKATETDVKKSTFETLASINVNDHVDKKASGGKELTYLSWAWAVDQISRLGEWSYKILQFDAEGMPVEAGLPYQKVLGGYMVHTEVTFEGQTKRMWLPIMDSHNAPMKDEPYKVTTKYSSYTVPAVDAMAINKTIMRCLVKNLGMFGLGLYIYAGEDLPDSDNENTTVEEKKAPTKKAPLKVTKDGEVVNDRGKALAHIIQEGPTNKDKQNFLAGKPMIEVLTCFNGQYTVEQTNMIIEQGCKIGSEADKKAFADVKALMAEGLIAYSETAK